MRDNILIMEKARRWMNDEDNHPINLVEAAEALRITDYRARSVRDLIYLENEGDLDRYEIMDCYHASNLLATNKVSKARTFLDPMIERRFGKNSHGPGGPMTSRDLAKKRMMSVVTPLTDGTHWIRDLEVPYISKRERKVVLAELDEAIRAIKVLQRTIESGGSHNYGKRQQ